MRLYPGTGFKLELTKLSRQIKFPLSFFWLWFVNNYCNLIFNHFHINSKQPLYLSKELFILIIWCWKIGFDVDWQIPKLGFKWNDDQEKKKINQSQEWNPTLLTFFPETCSVCSKALKHSQNPKSLTFFLYPDLGFGVYSFQNPAITEKKRGRSILIKLIARITYLLEIIKSSIMSMDAHRIHGAS